MPGIRPSRSYHDRDLKLLWGLAAARCSHPNCRKPLIKEATEHDPHAVLGKIAHINDFSPSTDSPRADSSLTITELNAYENLILLCGDHHDEIDKQKRTFPRETLLKWKREHETWVFSRLQQVVPTIGFAELEVVCQGILAGTQRPSELATPTPPAEKMLKNKLTEKVRLRLTLGLSVFSEVEHFVQSVARLSPHFPEQLKAGFVRRYNELVQQGIEGDALFEALHDFASSGSSNFERQAAGLGVLCYLFQKCEVFEP
ncbi:MAG: HNH endonuclease [Verrucomicrobia bacterium]|nr:HNH endonuclease [Verrucomicrobiota bacterium]